MRGEAFVDGREVDSGKGGSNFGPMPHRCRTRGHPWALAEGGAKGGKDRAEFAGLAAGNQRSRFIMHAAENLAMEEIGQGQDSGGLAAYRPRGDVGREGPEARPRSGKAADARKGYAESGEGAGADDRGKQVNLGRGSPRRLEERFERREEALRVPVIGLERA